VEVELDRLAVIVHDDAKKDGSRAIRAVPPAEHDTIHQLYDRFAAGENGPIHRNAFLWDRRMNVPDQDTRAFLVEGDAGPEGYCSLYQERKHGFRSMLHVVDQVALTPAAARTLLSFYADHRSMGSTVEWFGALHDPLLTALREARISCDLFFPWMIRIVDVQRAIAERGYPVGLEAEFHLAVKDELIAANNDRFVVRVAGGKAEARRGGKGTIQLGIRGLASMWAGFLSPRAARACGLLDGPDDELDRAAPAFAGSPPWMPDMF
jgi:predicted acetyltransferase